MTEETKRMEIKTTALIFLSAFVMGTIIIITGLLYSYFSGIGVCQ